MRLNANCFWKKLLGFTSAFTSTFTFKNRLPFTIKLYYIVQYRSFRRREVRRRVVVRGKPKESNRTKRKYSNQTVVIWYVTFCVRVFLGWCTKDLFWQVRRNVSTKEKLVFILFQKRSTQIHAIIPAQVLVPHLQLFHQRMPKMYLPNHFYLTIAYLWLEKWALQ